MRRMIWWIVLLGLLGAGAVGVGAKAEEWAGEGAEESARVSLRLVPLLDPENFVIGGKVLVEQETWSGSVRAGFAPGQEVVYRAGIAASFGEEGGYGVDYGKWVGGPVPGWGTSRGISAGLMARTATGGEVKLTAFGGALLPGGANAFPDSVEATFLEARYRETTHPEPVTATRAAAATTGRAGAKGDSFYVVTLRDSLTCGGFFLDLEAGLAGGGEGLPGFGFRPGSGMPFIRGYADSTRSGDRFAFAGLGYRRELVQDSARYPWLGGLSGEVFLDLALLAGSGERLLDADRLGGYGAGLVMPLSGFDLRFDLGWSSEGGFVPMLRMVAAR